MKKSIVRVLAMLMVFTLAAVIMISADGAVMIAKAASAPVFSLETNVSTAKTGDIFTVSLYVTNNSDTSISSFDGDISFNGSHFRYIDFAYPDNMRGKLTCLDNVAQPSSKISLSFADTSKLLIPAGAAHVLLLQVRFEVTSIVAGNGQVICSIKNCYGGNKSYENIEPTNFLLPVMPTQPPQSTTTTQTTTTTTQSTKPRSSDAKLKSLSIAPGMLSPAFNPEFVAYTVNVEFEIATIRISATANSDEAVVSGVGVKDLAVGQNTFTVTVTAGDGTVMQYGIVVIRAQETPSDVPIIIDQTSSTSETTTTTGSMAPIYSETAPLPEQTTPVVPEKVIEDSGGMSDAGMVKVMGIVFAEVALFMFGFLAGFFLDKNMKKKSMAEMNVGPVERPYPRRPMMPQPPYPPAMPRQPEYQQEFAPAEYQENYSSDYNSFPQYDGYDEPQYDEYGNPVDSSEYDVYFDENDSYYN